MMPKTYREHYELCIANGCTPKMAAALASRQFPGTSTDDDWWRGQKHFSEEFGEDYADDVKQKLAAQGITLGRHDDYVPALARHRGDRNAVISGHNARSQVAKALGRLKRHQQRIAEAPRVPLAEDIVRETVSEMVAQDPSLKRKKYRELREQVIEKHAPKF